MNYELGMQREIKKKPLYTFWGKVVHGSHRGKSLGFPTANVSLHKKIPEGIYAAQVQIDKKIYLAATFIGNAKTFGEKDYKSESFFLKFDGNVYGKWVSVRLCKKLRENKKFNSEKELISQMKKDIQLTHQFFQK